MEDPKRNEEGIESEEVVEGKTPIPNNIEESKRFEIATRSAIDARSLFLNVSGLLRNYNRYTKASHGLTLLIIGVPAIWAFYSPYQASSFLIVGISVAIVIIVGVTGIPVRMDMARRKKVFDSADQQGVDLSALSHTYKTNMDFIMGKLLEATQKGIILAGDEVDLSVFDSLEAIEHNVPRIDFLHYANSLENLNEMKKQYSSEGVPEEYKQQAEWIYAYQELSHGNQKVYAFPNILHVMKNKSGELTDFIYVNTPEYGIVLMNGFELP